jgi:hypothetical protein
VIYVTTNSGVTWSTNLVDHSWLGPWSSVACSADATTFFAASGDGIFLSTDAGQNWRRTHAPDDFQSIATSADGSQLAAAAKGAIVYTSTDFGTNWSRAELGDTSAPLTTVAMSADGSRIYAAPRYFPVYLLQSTPIPVTPKLVVDQANLDVFWPFPSTNLALQTTTDPSSNFWTDVPNRRVLNLSNLQNQVSLPIQTQPAFFRLASFQGLPSNFQNLDFEAATIGPVAPTIGSWIPFSNAFPGWIGLIGTNLATVSYYDVVPLDSARINIMTNTDGTWDGKYYAGLFSGIDPPLRVASSIRQTGQIPLQAKSLLFKWSSFDSGMVGVTLNGQSLNVMPLGGTLYGANVTGFTGTTAELSFTVQPVPTNISGGFLDSVQFSVRVVP